MTAPIEETLAELAQALTCSQCGQTFATRACGPTHAVIQADPRQHRLIRPLILDAIQDLLEEFTVRADPSTDGIWRQAVDLLAEAAEDRVGS